MFSTKTILVPFHSPLELCNFHIYLHISSYALCCFSWSDSSWLSTLPCHARHYCSHSHCSCSPDGRWLCKPPFFTTYPSTYERQIRMCFLKRILLFDFFFFCRKRRQRWSRLFSSLPASTPCSNLFSAPGSLLLSELLTLLCLPPFPSSSLADSVIPLTLLMYVDHVDIYCFFLCLALSFFLCWLVGTIKNNTTFLNCFCAALWEDYASNPRRLDCCFNPTDDSRFQWPLA